MAFLPSARSTMMIRNATLLTRGRACFGERVIFLRGGGSLSFTSTVASSERNKSKLSDREQKIRRKFKAQQKVAERSQTPVNTKHVVKTWKTQSVPYDKDTPAGHKKDISGPLPAVYSPSFVEACWYDWWDTIGLFNPDTQPNCSQNSQTFSMVFPPPNVTGKLHLGHALTVAIEDCLIRWKRMRGKKTVWVPGSDHAGIATQVVVEKLLKSRDGLNRKDMTRDQFMTEVWKWKEGKESEIFSQLRRLGGSFDWTRCTFTMDKQFSDAVTQAFVQLHRSGKIYRSEQLVNWSCHLQSAVSDIEVNTVPLSAKTSLNVPDYENKVDFGQLILFSYPVEGREDTSITVATTRLETMLGDVAIAIHPDDTRYSDLHNCKVKHPFTGRILPIILDTSVDPDFGSGAVKITPGHDFTDFEIGERHGLGPVSVISGDGMIIGTGSRFDGMPRFVARSEIFTALDTLNLIQEVRDHPMILPVCSRSNDVIEPLLKPQWFLDLRETAERAVALHRDGTLKIIPEHHGDKWTQWMERIRPWCISRQLWWGHPIPAFRVTDRPDSEQVNGPGLSYDWIVAPDEETALKMAVRKYNTSPESVVLEQDRDVLDTWFSSALFPFVSHGWPQSDPMTSGGPNLYPLNVMETGHDILFFWVARMVMLGLELTDTLPFNHIYLHSIIHDSYGRKMSKSLGNIIDPSDIINGRTLNELITQVKKSNVDELEETLAIRGWEVEFPDGIPQCGSDALRFALCSYRAQSDVLDFNIASVIQASKFCNKIWNGFKFIQTAIGDGFHPDPDYLSYDNMLVADKWVMSRMSAAVYNVNDGLGTYSFTRATESLENFWWHDLCDIYMESIKPRLNRGDVREKEIIRQVLYQCTNTALRLMSPFMPFITEELYQRLCLQSNVNSQSICVADYPVVEEVSWKNVTIESDMHLALNVIEAVRNSRAKNRLTKQRQPLIITCVDLKTTNTLSEYGDVIGVLSRSSSVKFEDTPPPSADILGSTTLDFARLHIMQ